jgi:serine/threonine protein kinase
MSTDAGAVPPFVPDIPQLPAVQPEPAEPARPAIPPPPQPPSLRMGVAQDASVDKKPPRTAPPPDAAPVRPTRRSNDLRLTRMDQQGRPEWANLELFRNMGDDAVLKLRDAMEAVHYEPGDVILRQGDEGNDMFLLDQGSVRVTVRGELKDTNFERVLVTPALFGEMALVTRTARTATVAAEERVRCLRLSKDGFDELVKHNPNISMFLTKAVGERLLEASSISSVSKYRVTGRLGAGAVATVFEAVNPALDRPVALKMLSHALVFNPKFAQQFRAEAKLVAQLDHEHIVRVYDTEKAYGTHFIVMEKLSGVTLDDLIRGGTRLSWGTVRRILREIALALDYSHARGLLHRDIKPSNVFLTDEDRKVKLLDFGIAVAAAASKQGGGSLLGTPYYMSPEQISGQQLDGTSDLYSLGILAYELITHNMPFDAETLDELLYMQMSTPTPDPRERSPDCPDDLCEFVQRATAKKPADRFKSCGEAVTFLQLASELPVVHRIELTTLAISYHPSRWVLVDEAVQELHRKLDNTPGVAILHAHQKSHEQKE